MSREILQYIITNFDLQKLRRFFSEKNRKFRPSEENLNYESDEIFSDGKKLGEISFEDGNLLVCVFKVKKELTERSGKKAQYDLGKKILKETQTDAGIFIFCDKNSHFRFSLIYTNYLGKIRDWSAFRRFTYFVSSDPQVTNKTFLQRIGDGDFSSLENVKETFSVEKVTKDFYKDIAYWYFWAVKSVKFPEDAEKEKNGRKIAVIRLITRLIFIWFMRERGLVPKDLFEEVTINQWLKDFSPEQSTYYKAILQNLFFATLNTPNNERQFAVETRGYRGHNEDFGNDLRFRYHECFHSPEKLNNYFGDIPFLNGGLFECLDDRKAGIIIDGFSRTKKNQSEVPNKLFFSNEHYVDLNTDFGTKNKKYKVQGILNTLSSYNFTIDENTSDDQDIALDPELLGKVFENLLASFNPETETTARKATGSYYTPREIVDYMVSQSLKEYFKTHISDITDLNEKLEQLFSSSSQANPFNPTESKTIVSLVENVRIVDPAVGSGAFPMGALNKLVFILSKVDSNNVLWKQAQLDAVESIPDPRIKQESKEHIEKLFKEKNVDYGRKLYLIQRCIYGVDIQQIAVEIAKLRFFISLLVDEKIDREKFNRGIQPLPNLDFKIMQGNSLISEFMGIDFDATENSNDKDLHSNKEKSQYLKDKKNKLSSKLIKLYNANNLSEEKKEEIESEINNIAKELKIIEKENQPKKQHKSEDTETTHLIKHFEQRKTEYQNEPDKDKKEKLKLEIDVLIIQIFETKLKKQNESYFARKEEIERKYSVLPNQKQREEIIAKEKRALSKSEGFDLENIEKQLTEFTGKNKTKPFFAWKLYFAEVFNRQNPGFDIVIANPPYIKEYTQKAAFDGLRNSLYYQGKMDLWYLFACRDIDLLKKDSGVLSFIAQNNWVTSYGASILRKKVINETTILSLIDFGDYKIFESAGIQTMVMIFQKKQHKEKYSFDYRRLIGQDLKFEDVLAILNKYENKKAEYLQPTIVRKELRDKPLTFSDTHINAILEKMISKNNFQLTEKEIANGIHHHHDRVNKERKIKLDNKYNIGDGIFVLSDNEKKGMNLSKKELELIKPSYTTKEIKKWCGNPKNREWVIYTDSTFKNEEKIESFPKLKEHLGQFKKVITSDNKPYGLHRSRDEYFFKGEKIISVRKCATPTFAYINFDSYVSATFYVIKSERINQKFLVALLNSSLIVFWLKHKGKMQGNNFQVDKEPIIDIPIVKPPDEKQIGVINLVDKILALINPPDYLENSTKQKEIKEYEKQIDQMIYELYGLTEDEIAIVEGKSS